MLCLPTALVLPIAQSCAAAYTWWYWEEECTIVAQGKEGVPNEETAKGIVGMIFACLLARLGWRNR